MMNISELKNKLNTASALVHWKLEGFRNNTKGVAAIEFAFLAPLMLLMYVGTIEVSSAVSANRKLSRSASAVGALITQIETNCMQKSTIDDIVKIADNIMKPHDAGIKILITGVLVNADGTNDVEWSEAYGGAVKPALGSTYTLPTQIASNDGFVVAAKVTKSYTPAFGWANFSNGSVSFTGSAINMEEELFLRPRVGNRLDPCPT